MGVPFELAIWTNATDEAGITDLKPINEDLE